MRHCYLSAGVLLGASVSAACGDAAGPPSPPAVAGIELISAGLVEAERIGELPERVIVRVHDAEGSPIARARISWSGSVVTSGDEVTDAHGRASATWNLAAISDTQRLRATAAAHSVEVKAIVKVRALAVEPENIEVAPGHTVHYSVAGLDVDGNHILVSPLAAVGDGNVATPLESSVTAQQPGVTSVTFAFDDATRTVNLQVGIPPAILVGQVFAANGADVTSERVAVPVGAASISAPLDSDGRFSVAFAPAPPTVVAHFARNHLAQRFHSVTIAVPAEERGDLSVVLVPLRWTIRKGAYAGTAIDVSPAAGFGQPCTINAVIDCQGYYREEWRDQVTLWRETDLPLPLMLDHGGSQPAWTAADSALLWSHIDELEAESGEDWFAPATLDTSRLEIHFGRYYGLRGVRVFLDETNPRSGGGALAGDDGALRNGIMHLSGRTALSQKRIVKHELMHVMGFAHTCNWASLLGGYCPSVPWTDAMSREDVAYAELARRVWTLQRDAGARYALTHAMLDELSKAESP